jgi:maleate cis-trans isomerase
MIKPSSRSSASHDVLTAMLPPGIRTATREAPVKQGKLEEFAAAIPAYAEMVAQFAAEGADLIHPEGTPAFLILGYDEERRTVDAWEKAHGVPVFTSAMCQAHALKALGVRKLVDAGYDPTTGPHAERYFRAAGFDVLAVVKVPVDWLMLGDISDADSFAMLSKIVRDNPGADGLCLQGSGKWRLSVVERLERELGIAVVHPIAARYWELLHRLGRPVARAGQGRLLAEMPKI